MLLTAGVDYYSSSIYTHNLLFKNKYSLVIINEKNEIIFSKKSAYIKEIIQLIKKLKPRILAIDNINEIGTKRELLYFIRGLPDFVDFVQITGAPKYDYVPLTQIIERELGIKIQKKLNSLETAYFCAVLANRGIGYKILIDTRYRIIITRSKHPGKGGWSQQRYQRLFQVKVKEVANEVEYMLIESNIPYEKIVYETDFGYKKAIFDIEENKGNISKIKSLIRRKNINDSLVKIKIEKKLANTILFVPLNNNIRKGGTIINNRKYIIVGVDPGTTTGIACLDVDGNLIHLESRKEWSRNDVIRLISEIGIPVLIASDVTPPPDFVSKLAATLKVPLFYPDKTLSVNEKREIVNEYSSAINEIQVNNTHERDALSAALKAFYYYKPKLEKITAVLKAKKIPSQYYQIIKAEVMHGKTVADAIKEMLNDTTRSKNEEKNHAKAKKNIKDNDIVESAFEEIKKLKEKIAFLEHENEKLRLEIKNLKNVIIYLEEKNIQQTQYKNRDDWFLSQINTLREENKLLKEQIAELTEKLQKVKELNRLASSSEVYVVKVIADFSSDYILDYKNSWGISKGDIIYFKNGGGGKTTAELVIALGVKAIIINKQISHTAYEKLANAKIPIIESNRLNSLKVFGNFGTVLKAELNNIIKDELKRMEEYSKKKAESTITQIIEEYRRNRWT
ncbi:MAG: DUF460 domain-containing protein [Candidatus Asgardarchaeia archaeon]